MFRKPQNQGEVEAAAESQRIIEAGGLPPSATARLQENAARQNTPSHIFTSNLSVNELLLTHECGFEPLGQIMGTSVYHVGWQYLPGQTWGQRDPYTGLPLSQELGVLTQANYEARNLTFGRLLQEAAILKADGVVGVRFERIQGDFPSGTFEFKAVGTAVRRKNAPPGKGGTPFMSNLNGQDHWALRKMGMQPIGFVFGNCSWYQVSSWQNQYLDTSGGMMGAGNAELPDFTQGVYTAREIAMERLEIEARHLGASGVVGVTIEPHVEFAEIDSQNNGRRRDLIVQFTVFGTAIANDPGVEANVGVQQAISLSG